MYQFKIQWAFNSKKSAKAAIKLLGAKSMDKLVARTLDDKIIEDFKGMHHLPSGLSDDAAKKWIDKMYKRKETIYIEFLRK